MGEISSERRRWDPQLEGGLPDCRLTGHRRRATTIAGVPTMVGRVTMERVYCANCGAPGGAVTQEWAAHIFYVCDDCAGRLGPIPLPLIDERLLGVER